MLAPRRACATKGDLMTTTQQIITDGGEGAILRKPLSTYEHGRSINLLKFKATRGDREALVVGIESDIITLQLPDGGVFDAKSPLEFREIVPKKGDIVSFSYQHFSKNEIPIDPKVYRVREDLSWKDVVQNYVDQVPPSNYMNEVTQNLFQSNNPNPPAPSPQQKPHAYWTSKKGKNMRKFFDRFAKSRNFDPLVSANWYSVLSSDIKQEKNGRGIINRWGGSLVRALMTLYPNIGLQEQRFNITMRNYWNTNENKRSAMDEYAKSNAFDPLVPENWYSIPTNQFMDHESGPEYVVRRYFSGSLAKALISLYPEISFDISKFKSKRNYWPEIENRKRFFDNYAKESGFDPLIPENWYHVSSKDMSKISGGMLKYNNQSVGAALLEVYPNIGLDVTKFSTTLHKWYADPKVRKSFCDQLATSLKFDPLNPENWYKISYRQILDIKGGSSVLKYYDYNMANLIMDSYPDIQLERNLFLRKNFVNIDEYMRKFFVELAEMREMDPLDPNTWYSLASTDVVQRKGGSNILDAHGGYMKSVMAIFPDIGLQEIYLKNKRFTEPLAIRHFCDELAESLGFDPLKPENWYAVTYRHFLACKGGNAVLKQFKYVTADLLLSVYPSIGLDRTQIAQKVEKSGPEYQRAFLCDLADERHLDPLNPDTWYQLSAKDIIQRKGGSHILEPYGSYIKATMQLFPDVGLQVDLFKSMKLANQYGRSKH